MKSLNTLLLAVVIIIWFGACYQNKQGCLDNYATNYDFAADEVCEEACCVYPDLKLSITHVFNGLPFIMKDTFVNNLGASFLVINQKIYFSDITLFSEREKINLQKSENITLKDGSNIELESNYKLLRDVLPITTLNQIKAVDSIKRIKFNVGLTDYLNQNINPNTVSTSSDLSISAGMVDDNNKYYSYLAKVVCGSDLKDTLDIFTYSSIPFEKALNPSLKQIPGKEVAIGFKMNYFNLFKDIDFKSADKATINAKLEENLKMFVE